MKKSPNITTVKQSPCTMELENGLHNLKAYTGCVDITNKQTGQSCRIAIDDNIQLGNLFDVLFDRKQS